MSKGYIIISLHTGYIMLVARWRQVSLWVSHLNHSLKRLIHNHRFIQEQHKCEWVIDSFSQPIEWPAAFGTASWRTAKRSNVTWLHLKVGKCCLRRMYFKVGRQEGIKARPNPMALGAFDFNRRCTEWSVYDIKVPREPFESIGSVCSLIALAILWCHTLTILRSTA